MIMAMTKKMRDCSIGPKVLAHTIRFIDGGYQGVCQYCGEDAVFVGKRWKHKGESPMGNVRVVDNRGSNVHAKVAKPGWYSLLGQLLLKTDKGWFDKDGSSCSISDDVVVVSVDVVMHVYNNAATKITKTDVVSGTGAKSPQGECTKKPSVVLYYAPYYHEPDGRVSSYSVWLSSETRTTRFEVVPSPYFTNVLVPLCTELGVATQYNEHTAPDSVIGKNV